MKSTIFSFLFLILATLTFSLNLLASEAEDYSNQVINTTGDELTGATAGALACNSGQCAKNFSPEKLDGKCTIKSGNCEKQVPPSGAINKPTDSSKPTEATK